MIHYKKTLIITLLLSLGMAFPTLGLAARQSKQPQKLEPYDKKLQLSELSGKSQFVTPVTMTTKQIMQQNNPITCGETTAYKHFTAATYKETGREPFSTDGAVGSSQIMAVADGRIRTFCINTGQIDNVLNTTLDKFFSVVTGGLVPGIGQSASAVFDQSTGTWFIAYAVASTNQPTGRLLLAWGQGDPITADTPWNFFVVDSASNPEFIVAIPSFGVSGLGVDTNAVYLGASVSDFANLQVLSSAVYVIPKSTLTSSGATVWAFRNLVETFGAIGPINPAPAQNSDNPQANNLGVIASVSVTDYFNEASPGQILIQTVDPTATTPTLSTPQIVTVDPYVYPIDLLIKASANEPAVLPERLIYAGSFAIAPAVHIRGGILYFIQKIGLNISGISDSSADRNGARFYKISPYPPSPSLLDQGNLYDSLNPAATALSYLSPSIMPNQLGQVIVGATTGGPSAFFNATYTYVFPTSTTVPFTLSSTAYYPTEDWQLDPFVLWSGYSRVAIGTDNITFYPIIPWCSDTDVWAIEVAQVPPPTLKPTQKK